MEKEATFLWDSAAGIFLRGQNFAIFHAGVANPSAEISSSFPVYGKAIHIRAEFEQIKSSTIHITNEFV